MNELDISLFLLVNRFTRATGWLHGPAVAYASYGVVLFAALLLAGWWSARVRPGPAVMAAAVVMAAARVYVGAHWPWDVVAGLVLGAVVTVIGYLLLRGLLELIVGRLAATRLRPLVTAAPAGDPAGVP